MFYLIILACLLLAPALVVAQVCYDPSGNVLNNFGVCNNATNSSLCCPISNVCMANGLCLNPLTGNFNRGGCTEKSYTDTICPSYCTATSFPEILPCNTSSTNSFCCDSEAKGQCCQDPSTFLGIGPAVSSAQAVPASTKSTSSTSTSNSTSTTSPSWTPTGSPTTAPGPSHPNTSVKVGVGVGVSVGSIAALSALAFFLFRRRKRSCTSAKEEDEVPELPPLLAHNRMNSKLFPAELDPEGEGLKGPAELHHESSTQARGPVELATATAELPAEPVEPEHDVEDGSIQATPVDSRAPSLKKDNILGSHTSQTEATVANSSVQPSVAKVPASEQNDYTVPDSHTLHSQSLRPTAPTTSEASSPQSNRSLQVPPPPPPSLATMLSSATTSPRSSPPRGEFIRHGKGAGLIHPNQSAWSLEQEQDKIISADKGGQDLPRPRTIAERRNMGSPSLSTTSGPWHDAYDAVRGESRADDAGPGK